MSKNKVKLLLVEDYIELNKIQFPNDENSFKLLKEKERNILSNVQTLKNQLIEVYEKIFFRFGLMDVSYLLLKEGLSCTATERLENFNILDIEKILSKLKIMVDTLSLKLKKLSLNEIEMKYIIQNLSM